MESLFFHPKLVHIPMALAVLMPLVALAIGIAWWRSWLPSRAWALVVLLQAVLVGSGFVAMQSGEADEERAEAVVAEAAIEAHEEAAEVFVWTSAGVLGLMALGLFAARNPRVAGSAAAAATAGTILVFGLGYRVGQAGGELVYRHGAASVWVTASGGGGEAPAAARLEAGEHHDDDEDDDD